MMPGNSKESVPTGEEAGLQLNLDYFKGPHGIIKGIQLVLGIVLICIGKPFWLAIPVYTLFFVTLAWVGIHLLSVPRKYRSDQDWPRLELFYTGGAAAVYGVAVVVAFISAYIMFAIFGVLVTVAYAAGTYFLMQESQLLDSQQSSTMPNV